MNPGSNELQLPTEKPETNVGKPAEQSERFVSDGQKSPEQTIVSEAGAAQVQHSMPRPVVDPAILAQMQAVQATQPIGMVDQSATLAPAHKADNVDLIEKTWVQRAKSIIEKTRNDPYIQKNEISKVKAEYIEKRFSKKTKLFDDSGKP